MLAYILRRVFQSAIVLLVVGLVAFSMFSYVGDPVDNPKVGPMLVDKVIQGDPAVAIPERLEALLPGERSAPLAKYLKRADLPAAP